MTPLAYEEKPGEFVWLSYSWGTLRGCVNLSVQKLSIPNGKPHK